VAALAAYREVLGHRPFALFWGGFSLSVAGDAMTRVALTWFVYQTTQSAVAVGWLTFFYTAPVVIGGLVAGWLLDRFDRRTVMIADSLLKAMVVVSVPLLAAAGWLEIWHAYAVAAVYGLMLMVPLAGTPAMLPDLVAPARLNTANALETMAFTLSGVIGPPIAGILIAQWSAPEVLYLDAATYLLFAAALASLGPRGTNNVTAGETAGDGKHGLGEAFRLLLGNRILLSTTAMYMAANIAVGAVLVWLPIYASRELDGGAALYGILLGVIAVGEIAGSLLAGLDRLRVPLGTLICAAQFASGVALAVMLAGTNLALTVVCLALYGALSAPLTIWAQTLRMKIIPERQRGRTFALLRMLMQSTNPLGGLLAGFLLPVVGMAWVIAISAAAIGLPGLAGYRVAELRRAS
jgi:MFS family permease